MSDHINVTITISPNNDKAFIINGGKLNTLEFTWDNFEFKEDNLLWYDYEILKIPDNYKFEDIKLEFEKLLEVTIVDLLTKASNKEYNEFFKQLK